MKTKPNHILITGGAGYIGSKLAMQLLTLGNTVSVIDDLSTGLLSNIPDNVKFYQEDINTFSFDNLFSSEKPDCIFHMAASKSVNDSLKNPEKFRKNNIDGSKRVIDAALKHEIKKFVFTSTAGVYGDVISVEGQKESDKLNPSSFYAETKLEIERYILEKNAVGLNGIIVRFANVYGSGGKSDLKGAINTFIESLMTNTEIYIHGDGTQTRDFVHIDDLISLCLLLITSNPDLENDTPIYNVSTGLDISINRLIEIISAYFHKSPNLIYKPDIFAGQMSSKLSIEKTKRILGWSAQKSLINGIAEMVTAYTNNL